MWTILPITDIRNNDIANWDKPWLSELDITSGISEVKLLISDFSIVDFRFSGIAICDFGFLNSGFRFLISKFWFEVSDEMRWKVDTRRWQVEVTRRRGAFTIWMEFSVAFSGQMKLHFFPLRKRNRLNRIICSDASGLWGVITAKIKFGILFNAVCRCGF